MSTQAETVRNASGVATISSAGLTGFLVENAQVISITISILSAFVFIVSVFWASYNGWRRNQLLAEQNKINKRNITQEVIDKIPPELQDQVKSHLRG